MIHTMSIIAAEIMPYDFWTNLLEKGGLPALAVGIMGTIFLIQQRYQSKATHKRLDQQTVREKQQVDQYHELMMRYSVVVDNLLEVANSSTRAVTILSERVGQCPLRDIRLQQPSVTQGDTNEPQ